MYCWTLCIACLSGDVLVTMTLNRRRMRPLLSNILQQSSSDTQVYYLLTVRAPAVASYKGDTYHAQETYARNFQTQPTNQTAQFGHVHRRNFLVQISCTSFLSDVSVCHPYLLIWSLIAHANKLRVSQFSTHKSQNIHRSLKSVLYSKTWIILSAPLTNDCPLCWHAWHVVLLTVRPPAVASYGGDTHSRNLYKQLVAETFEHCRPIQPDTFGHVYRRKFL